MKIVFHDRFYVANYSMDPAASPGRIKGIMNNLKENKDFEFIIPTPATKEDILKAHTERHYTYIEGEPLLFELASLAAGASILAAEEAFNGNPSFAVIRPPGHHASSDSAWGFCFFNNVSISLLKLFSEKKIKSAFVLDFDLHDGDGNIGILMNRNDGFRVEILNPMSSPPKYYLKSVKDYMEDLKEIDIITASAGFDQGIEDWGNLLSPKDYTELGSIMKEYSEKLCNGRRYALLEGGYNHNVLGKNVDAFCQGFK